MAQLRRATGDMPVFDDDYFSGSGGSAVDRYDPTAASGGGQAPYSAPPLYAPPNGNTGVSGYAPGGKPAPAPEQQGPQFDGSNYQDYIMQLLGPGPTSEQKLRNAAPELSKIGVDTQIASDGTARGRITVPGVGPVTLIGDRQTWGDGGWAWRSGAEQYGSGGGGGGPQMIASSLPPAQQGGVHDPEIWERLKSIFESGGEFNQGIVNRRSENAATALRRDAKSRTANNEAYLASRGLIGSGPQATAQNNVTQDIADRYANEVSNIYADEGRAADDRMMSALGLATGMNSDAADRALGYYRAGNDFTLGQGQLALGSTRAANDYNLGLGDFGLRREELAHSIESGDVDQLIELLKLYMSGAQTSAGGHY
jgi:hypothetical protein